MFDSAPKLTARQQQILELIQSAIARTGAPPTRAEIASELGFKSANAAEEHLQALARKGVIELVSGTSRGIRLRSVDLQSINQSRSRQLNLPLPGLSQLSQGNLGYRIEEEFPGEYAALKRDKFRLHFQYLRASDLPVDVQIVPRKLRIAAAISLPSKTLPPGVLKWTLRSLAGSA